MLDIKFIRENTEVVKKAVQDKLMNVDIDHLLDINTEMRALTLEIENLRAERNISTQKVQSGEKSQELIEQVKEIKKKLSELETNNDKLKEEYEHLMLCVPSIPAPEVPIGSGEEDNVELRRVGNIRKFDFTPKDHIELAEMLDLIDIPRAVKIAGTRSYILKNEGMLLELAVCRYVTDVLVAKGFVPMSVPVMVKHAAMQGTGYFPIGYDQAYKLQEDELFLVGTSEVSLVSYNSDEVIPYEELPKKYTGYSTCFRREAGSAGRDTRGLYRVHQFQKVEQVVICEADVEVAKQWHDQILQNVEEIMQSLELPYRVALACTGEIGIGQVKKYEVETWMPSRSAYSETHSCSFMGDFQSRRLNIKYKDGSGKAKYAYTLNNTGIASPRILIPILENNQEEDGSVRIPKVLVPYMNGKEVITPK